MEHKSQTKSTIENQQPTLTNELLEDLANPSMSAFEMCQIHQLTLIELADLLKLSAGRK